MIAYGQSKGLKRLQDIRIIYTLYNPHTIPLSNRNWLNDDVWIVVCIDPGLVHLAVRVESRNQRTNVIKTLFFTKQDVYSLMDINDELDINQAPNIIYKIFEDNIELFTSCHLWIVEKQLPQNIKARDVSKYILSWAYLNLRNKPRLPLILELNSKAKYTELQAPTYLNEIYKKKWGTEKAIQLLQDRNDFDAINFILNEPKSKQNDLADTVIMIEAVFVYMGWPVTQKINKMKINVTKPITIQNDNSQLDKSKLNIKINNSTEPNKNNNKLNIKINNNKVVVVPSNTNNRKQHKIYTLINNEI